MSTLSFTDKNVDVLFKNTLIIVAVGWLLFFTLDILRGVPIEGNLLAINFLGAMFMTLPMMVCVAARNHQKWTTTEYTGIFLFEIATLAMIGIPTLGFHLSPGAIEEEVVGVLASRRLESFATIATGLHLVAIATLTFFGARHKFKIEKILVC